MEHTNAHTNHHRQDAPRPRGHLRLVESQPDSQSLIERHLRGEERLMTPSTRQLLLEVDRCGMPNVTRAATRQEYLRMQEHFAVFLAGYDVDLTDAAKKHVQAFVGHLQRTDETGAGMREACEYCTAQGMRGGYSASYVKRHLAALRALYDYLVDDGLAAGDPTRTVRRPSVPTGGQYIPSTDEVKALMDYHGTARSRLFVRLAYYAPARRSEFIDMRWQDIDENAVWHFTGKGGVRCALKLNAEVLRALRHAREAQEREARRHPRMAAALSDPETAYVFMTKRGKQMSGGQLVRVLKRHAVRAGVAVIPAAGEQWDAIDGMTSRMCPHALRRAWASHTLNDPDAGASIDVVSAVLQHKDITTTRRHYAFTDDERVWDALRRRQL